MSNDLIRRSDAIKLLNDYLGDCYRVSRRRYEKTMLDAISMDFEAVIEDIPTIDLVRCAECKHKRLYDDDETKYFYCALEIRPNRNWSVDDWNYCCWGERESE